MRTNIESRSVETHGVGQVADFRIKANGKAFKVLIDGLYSDKIRAVIREICSNAFDAHQMAGCPDVPFDLHLPSQFDPVFRVRDYGVGMDHDTIMHLYTTVFESSKEDTNEQVGKFGLGSKSPFAYTDSFTVTAFSGTEKRTYSAFIGPAYVPQIALMGVVASDEPRGIEVQFPVKSPDCWAFQTAAKATLAGFDVLPKITGAELNLNVREVVFEGTGWKLIRGLGYRAQARQGCVVYPLDPNAIDHITPFERAILSSPFFIDFPIGDLEISASREAIGYDQVTKDNIRARLNDIAMEIVDRYQEDIDSEPTMWRACLKFKKYTRDGLDQAVIDVLKARITYRGKPLRSLIDLSGMLRPLYDRTLENGGIRVMSLSKSVLDRGRYGGRKNQLKFDPSLYVSVAAGETAIVFDDASHPASLPQMRLRHWWNGLSEYPEHVLWVKASPNSMGLKRLLVALGRPDTVFNLADMERPPAELSAYDRRPTKVKVLRDPGNRWEETEIDEDDEIVYVELNRRHTVGHSDGVVTNPYAIGDIRKHLRALGYLTDTQQIIGIPKTHARKIGSNPHWVSLWDLVRKAVAEKYDETKVAQILSYEAAMRLRDPLSALFRMLAKNDAFTGFDDATSPAGILYNKWVEIVEGSEALSDLENAKQLHMELGGSVPDTPLIDFTQYDQAVMAAYPLLKYVLTPTHWIINDDTQHDVLGYVNMIDNKAAVVECDVIEDVQAAA